MARCRGQVTECSLGMYKKSQSYGCKRGQDRIKRGNLRREKLAAKLAFLTEFRREVHFISIGDQSNPF